MTRMKYHQFMNALDQINNSIKDGNYTQAQNILEHTYEKLPGAVSFERITKNEYRTIKKELDKRKKFLKRKTIPTKTNQKQYVQELKKIEEYIGEEKYQKAKEQIKETKSELASGYKTVPKEYSFKIKKELTELTRIVTYYNTMAENKLEKKLNFVLPIIAIVGILGSILFLSPSMTGNVIVNEGKNSLMWIGGIFLVLGIIAGFLWLKENSEVLNN